MSKWTTYQLIIIASFTALIVLLNILTSQLSVLYSWINSFISPGIIVIFFTVILIIWGFSFILLLQEKKKRQFFTHKLWRIMPAIMGVVFVISFIIFITLSMTVLGDLNQHMKWILDLLVVYFLVVFYLFVLSIVIRYGKADTAKGRIMTSANAAVLTLIVILFFIPNLI